MGVCLQVFLAHSSLLPSCPALTRQLALTPCSFTNTPLESAALAFLPAAPSRQDARETARLLILLGAASGVIGAAVAVGLPAVAPQLFTANAALWPNMQSVQLQVGGGDACVSWAAVAALSKCVGTLCIGCADGNRPTMRRACWPCCAVAWMLRPMACCWRSRTPPLW